LQLLLVCCDTFSFFFLISSFSAILWNHSIALDWTRVLDFWWRMIKAGLQHGINGEVALGSHFVSSCTIKYIEVYSTEKLWNQDGGARGLAPSKNCSYLQSTM